MAKKQNLNFSSGYRSDVQFFYQGQMINAIPWEKYCYPVPQYADNVSFPAITNLATSGFQISYKIQNNNFIGASGEPLEALFLASTATPVGGGESLDIDFRVAHKGLGDEGNYGYRTFNFQADGDGPIVGNFKALTAFGITDNRVDRYYVGFVGGIGSYIYSNGAPALPIEDVFVTPDINIKIIDIAYNEIAGDIYLIDSFSLYQMSFPSPTLTQITALPDNVDNFSSLTVNKNGVAAISATKGERQVIVVYETVTTNMAVYESPFSSNTIGFILKYSRSGDEITGGLQQPMMIASLGDGWGISPNFDATTPPAWTLFRVAQDAKFKSDVINDVCQQKAINIGNRSLLLAATQGGVAGVEYDPSIPALTILDASQLLNIETDKIACGEFFASVAGVDGTIQFVASAVSATGIFQFFAQEATFNAAPFGLLVLGLSASQDLASQIASLYQMEWSPTLTNNSSYWIADFTGKGTRSGHYLNAFFPTLDIQTLSENYNFELRDIVKADIFTYYFLFNEVGSSQIDANSVIASYDAQFNVFSAGAPGYFLPSDRLWVAGDTFIFRNSENTGSFYYKNIDNLSIDTVEANIITSEGLEGLISTTYAGSIVDIITTVDQFYLLGSRGIEIWQNVGAGGFPFRKENYLSIPYHLLPLSDEATFTYPISRWAYYKGAYVIVCLSNESNVLTIIQIKDGQYKKMQLDNTLFYTLIKENNLLEDITLQTLNWWGKDYLLIGLVTSQSVGSASPYFLISEDNRWAQLNGVIDIQEQFLLTASMNSIKTIYDAGTDEFRVQTTDSLPVSLNQVTNNYMVDSDKIEDECEFIVIKRILVHLDFPIEDLANWPVDATYTLSISEDGGRNFSIIGATTPLTIERRQVSASLETCVLEAIIRFECNYPVIVMGGIVEYEKGGITL